MTVNEAIQRVMTDRPGEATEAEMEKWLQDLDLRWQLEQIDTHWPTRAEYEAAKAAAEAEEAASDASPGPVDLSEYPANVNPSEMGWWVDDPEDMAGYFKIPTTDTSLVQYRQYFELPPQNMVSPEYMDVWTAAYAAAQAAAEEEDTVLLIQHPDDEVYIYWLYSKIDQRLGEIARYNNDAMLFNAAWDAAAKRWNRTHRYKGRQLRHVVYGSLPTPRPLEDPLNQRGDWYGWR
jgi:hypothetical protein